MSKSKVMIVDDCSLTLAIAKDLFEEAGFEVVTRSDSLGTTTAILAEMPSCVLMDVSMPALSGTQIVKLIKNSKKDIKVLLHSARDEEELKHLAHDCGADGYVKKTNDCSKLVEQVRSVIDN